MAVDIREDALALAKDIGAAHTINSKEISGTLAEAVKDTLGKAADVSVDALGIAQTCGPVIEALGVRGRHAQIGMTNADAAGHLNLPVDHIIANEISVSGVKGMPTPNFPALLAMVAQQKVRPDQLVTKQVRLDQVTEEMEAMSGYATLGFSVITDFAGKLLNRLESAFWMSNVQKGSSKNLSIISSICSIRVGCARSLYAQDEGIDEVAAKAPT